MSEQYFIWDPKKLTTQVKEMDDEHIRLIDLMNQLHSAHAEKKSFNEQAHVLNQLLSYAVSHFQHEEQFFSRLPYPQAEAHKKIHVDLVARLKDFAEKFKKEQVLTEEFFRFLKVWLSAHIMGVDAKYGQIAVDQRKPA